MNEEYRGEFCSYLMAGMYPNCKWCQEDKKRHDAWAAAGYNDKWIIDLGPKEFKGLESGCP